MTRAQLGRIGEQMAVRHLERVGMVVVERNWRCADGDVRGEVDVVARDGGVLVFCEVKARRGGRAGTPLEAITPRKVAQLRRLAGAYLARDAPSGRTGVRLDAVGVCWPAGGGRAEVVHVRGIG
jgi:putative endonuclease